MSYPPNNLNETQVAMVKASAYGINGSAEQDFISAVDDRLGLISYDQFGASGPTTPQVKAAVTAELNKGK
jgi:hypothetical protein